LKILKNITLFNEAVLKHEIIIYILIRLVVSFSGAKQNMLIGDTYVVISV